MAPAQHLPAPLEVVVYSRKGCHLCDDAVALLKRHGLPALTIDIDLDPRLQAQYHECVPVVVINGQERFRGRVNELLLKRLLVGLGAPSAQVNA